MIKAHIRHNKLTDDSVTHDVILRGEREISLSMDCDVSSCVEINCVDLPHAIRTLNELRQANNIEVVENEGDV